MAKKILAVILAVTVALSAMAISVFATDIPLFPSKDAWKNQTHSEGVYQVTFDIPIFGMYGYLTAGDYMIFQLPRDWNGNCDDASIDWTIQVMGQNYALPSIENLKGWGDFSKKVTPGNTLSKGEVEQSGKDANTVVKVSFGYFGRGWDGTETVIPQTVGYNTISTIRLIAEIKPENGLYDSWRIDTNMFKVVNNTVGTYATSVNAQYYKADGTPVQGSITYAKDWNATVVNGVSSVDNVYNFVTAEWVSGAEDETPAYPFTWDHTLEYRGIAQDAYNNNSVVELHIPLTKTLNGVATYTLYKNAYDATYSDRYSSTLWWQYEAGREFVAKYDLTKPTDELVFTLPSNALFDGVYGTYASEFVIFEDILLLNTSLMADYTHVDRTKVGGDAGFMGDLSWKASWENNDRAQYKGQPINYAKSGAAGVGFPTGTYSAYPTEKATNSYSKTLSAMSGGWKNVIDNANADDTAYTKSVTADDYVVVTGLPAGTPLFVQGDGSAAGNGKGHVQQTLDGTIVFDGADIASCATGWCNLRTGDSANIPAGTVMTCYTIPKSAINLADCGVANRTSWSDGHADVMATKGMKIVIVDAEDTTGEIVDVEANAPTDTTTQNTDTDDDETDVGDTETEAPAKEENPKTGVALAVIPMLVAAAAAVVAKKH